jgi:hypothetical protein
MWIAIVLGVAHILLVPPEDLLWPSGSMFKEEKIAQLGVDLMEGLIELPELSKMTCPWAVILTFRGSIALRVP